jgi:hypothetical protein
MLKFSIQSIINNNSNDYDILIITDEKYRKDYLSDINYDIVKYYIVQQTEDPNHIAFNRVKIFQYENIFDYDKTLYLDCDTIVNCSLSDIFQKCVKNKLNVVYEDNRNENHNRIQFGFQNYTDEELKYFEDEKIYTFNSGSFLFENTISMKKHFSNVLSMIENHSGSFFTDQSFLNYYFNTLGLVDYNSLRKFDNYLFITEETINTNLDNKILHFIQKTFIPNDRLNLMKNVYDELFRFEDRGVLIKKLKDIVNGKKGVEIGVFTGSFSKYILENWDGVLYMVDVWRPLGEEYEDMSNHLNYQNAYQLAMDNIKGYEDRGIMIRATSKDASNIFEDNSLDFIYIDANHAYDFVKEDIRIWFPKLKKGGIFSGHDYLDMVWENDPNFLPNGKDKYIYTNTFEGTSFYNGVFGVNPAVDEFCKENGYTVNTTKEWFGTWWIIK